MSDTLREISEGVKSLLNVQIIFLYGFKAVQSQIIERLTEHTDLPRLKLFSLKNTNTQRRVVTDHRESLIFSVLQYSKLSSSLTLSSAAALSPFLSPSAFAGTRQDKMRQEKKNRNKIIHFALLLWRIFDGISASVHIQKNFCIFLRNVTEQQPDRDLHQAFVKHLRAHTYLLHLLRHPVWAGIHHPPSSSSKQLRINNNNTSM